MTIHYSDGPGKLGIPREAYSSPRETWLGVGEMVQLYIRQKDPKLLGLSLSLYRGGAPKIGSAVQKEAK